MTNLSAPPAGGAALAEVIAATAGVGAVTALLLVLAVLHRTRRTTLLARFADDLGRRTGRPGWVALPTLLTTLALVTALFGMLWDISLHIGRGRDEGPLANPAHYFILVGLYLVFAAGMAAVVLPLDADPGPASVKITRTWRAPVGGLLVAASLLHAGPSTIFALLFATLSSSGFIGSNALAGALSVDPLRSGSTSGLAGASSFGAGAGAAALSGAFHDGTALPLAVVMLLSLSGAAAAYFGLAHRHEPA